MSIRTRSATWASCRRRADRAPRVTFDRGQNATPGGRARVRRPDWIVCARLSGWSARLRLNLSTIPPNPPPTFLVCAGTGDVFHAKQTVEFYNAFFEVGRTMKPKPLNIELHIYGAGQHAGAISPRKGIPFGTWHQRLLDWLIDQKFMPAPAKRDPATGGYIAE